MTTQDHVEAGGDQWPDWFHFAIFLAILCITWVSNVFLLVAIHRCRSRKLPHNVISNMSIESKLLPNYFFIASISVANILAASINPPIFIVSRWLNFNNNFLWRLYCLLSISANTVFCNLAFLHVLFSSLDTFLRLYSPRLYVFSQSRITTSLKMSAPWIVTCIQAGCQLSISSISHLRSKSLQCLIDDINFLILRSVISFAVPLITCVVLTLLQMCFLRRLPTITDEDLRSLLSSYVQKAHLPETFALINHVPAVASEHFSRVHYFSAPIQQHLSGETLVSQTSQDNTSLYILPILESGPSAVDYSCSNGNDIPSEKHQSHENQRTSFAGFSDSYMMRKRALWDFAYQREQISVALNMASCIVAIGVWSPLVLSTLTYRLCEQSSCFFQIPVERITNFQWLSYSGGGLYPLVYMFLDRTLRRAGLPLCGG